MSDLENSSASPISDDKKEPIKFHKLTPILDKELADDTGHERGGQEDGDQREGGGDHR